MRRSLILLSIALIISSFLFCQDLKTLIVKAINKIKIRDLKSAESLLQRALDTDPSFAPARVRFSELWLRRGDLVKANEYATMAVRIDEDFRSWWDGLNEIRSKIQRGRMSIQKGDYDTAMQEYQTVAKEYPYFPEAQYFMGLTKFRQKDFEGAAFYFNEALNLYPDHGKSQKGLNNVKKRFRK